MLPTVVRNLASGIIRSLYKKHPVKTKEALKKLWQKAYAIATARAQQLGYIKKGTHKTTGKGKAYAAHHERVKVTYSTSMEKGPSYIRRAIKRYGA